MEQRRALSVRLLSYADLEIASPLSRKDAFEQPSLVLEDLEPVLSASTHRCQMVWFYADWCGHCHKMKNAWEMAHQRGAQHDWHVVDCANAGSSLAEELGVRSFPTVKRVVDRQIRDFQAERTADNFLEFARGA